MVTLARSSTGRILLHLLAMVGDGNVRFHLVGIARELDAVAAARARMRERLQALWMNFLTSPVKTAHSMEVGESQSLSAVLLPGDVLLTEGNTRAALLIKYVTGSTWSHVSMYVGPLDEGEDPPCVVEADITAGVRAIRLSELNALNFRVLRPVGLSDIHRLALSEWTLARIGSGYDLAHAWALFRSLLPRRLPARLRPHRSAATGSASQFICSNLLASAFAVVGLSIAPELAISSAVEGVDHRHVTPADFARAQAFEVIEHNRTLTGV